MGFFARVVSRNTSFQEALAAYIRGDDLDIPQPTSSGVTVTEHSSLAITTVYSCIRVISQTMAMLPLITYERLANNGRQRATSHPLYRLLHDEPNPEQTAYDWRSLMSVHQNLWGAGISEIEFDGNGKPIALWPIPPWMVEPSRTQSGEVYYKVRMPDGSPDRILPSWATVVFRAVATSSYEWRSPIRTARETIGYAQALHEFGAKTFGQGTNPAGIVTVQGKPTEQAQQSLRESLKKYSGLSGAHRLMLLFDGQKFERVGLPPEDAQYIQSKEWTTAELARIWNVPLHLIQEHSKSTTWGSGLEELNLGYLTYTIQPFLEQWQQELHRRLFGLEGDRYYPEFNPMGLLRARVSERYTAYNTARNGGWMNANEIRALENMNPISEEDGGDLYLVQGAMMPMNQVGEDADPEPNQAEDTPPAEETEDAE